jgi:hypothetical protein
VVLVFKFDEFSEGVLLLARRRNVIKDNLKDNLIYGRTIGVTKDVSLFLSRITL